MVYTPLQPRPLYSAEYLLTMQARLELMVPFKKIKLRNTRTLTSKSIAHVTRFPRIQSGRLFHNLYFTREAFLK